jgi:hypothetical protein
MSQSGAPWLPYLLRLSGQLLIGLAVVAYLVLQFLFGINVSASLPAWLLLIAIALAGIALILYGYYLSRK